MNHSIYSADRMTHLKIVVVTLIVSIAVVGFGVSAKINCDDRSGRTARILKANEVVMTMAASASLVR